MWNPLVSVIMPAYNAASTISQSIESVLNQSYTNWELLIVDDGSSDNTTPIVTLAKEKDQRILLFTLKNNVGLSAARNEGIKNTRGELLAFLDSDDLWHPDKLRLQVELHTSNKKIAISHTNFSAFDTHHANKLPLRNLLSSKKKKEGILYPQLCYQNTIGVLTVMVKKNVLDDVGPFDTELKSLEDRDLWVRISKKNYLFGYLPRVLAQYRISESSLSGKTGKYKKCYKQFIKKIITSETVDHRLVWRSYYRYFGATYFKSNQHKLSRLYFWKSIKLFPYDFFSATSFFYMLYVATNGFWHSISLTSTADKKNKK